MTIIRLLTIFSFILIFSSDVFGQGWINTFGGPDTLNDYDQGLKIFEDHQGNLIHLGRFYSGGRYLQNSSIDSLMPSGTRGFFIEKLDKQGNKIWRHTVSGSSALLVPKIDDLGNLFIVGYISTKMMFYSPSRIDSLIPQGSTRNNPGGSFILKLNAQGNFVWVKEVNVYYYSLAISPNNDLVLGGKAFGQTDIDPGSSSTIINGNSISGSAFLCQFDNSGVFNWGVPYSNTSATIWQILIDSEKNIYVSGQYGNNGFDYDVFVRKMDSTRSLLWSRSFGGTGRENLISMRLDSKGNVILGGEYTSTVNFYPNTSSNILTPLHLKGIYILKYSNDGVFKQVQNIEGAGVRLYSLEIAKNDILVTCGIFQDTIKIAGNSMINNRKTSGSSDIFYTVQDSNGVYIASDTYGGLESDGATDIHIDDQNQIYLTGWYSGTVDFRLSSGSIPNISYGRFDGFILQVRRITTGVSKFQSESSKLGVYPNPSTGFVNLNSEVLISQLEIYNIQGRLIQIIKQPTKQIELPEVKGIYLLRLELENGELLTRKVVRD